MSGAAGTAAKLLLVVTGWILFSYLVSHLSGWRKLAKQYRVERPYTGKFLRPLVSSMPVGVNYQALLKLAASSEGLFISMSIFLRPGHPALFVPWSEISISRERFWRFEMAKVSLPCSTYLLIPLKFCERLTRMSGNQVRQ